MKYKNKRKQIMKTNETETLRERFEKELVRNKMIDRKRGAYMGF